MHPKEVLGQIIENGSMLCRLKSKGGITCPDVIAPLRERGITHVYIGQRQGRVNYAGPDVLQPERLLASSCFRPTFHQDRVWVFEVVS